MNENILPKKLPQAGTIREIPESITNKYPLRNELTAIAVATGIVAIPLIGFLWGLGVTAAATTLARSCLYDAKVDPIVKKNYEIRAEKDAKERSALYLTQTKAARKQEKAYSVVIAAALAGLCYKVAIIATPFIRDKGIEYSCKDNNSLFCFSLISSELCILTSVVASSAYLIKKIFE